MTPHLKTREKHEIITVIGARARCIDGRKNELSEALLGYQTPGASLFAPVAKAIYKNSVFDEMSLTKDLGEMREAGIGLGVHRDTHSKHDKKKSGCGFADNLLEIIKKAIGSEQEIRKILNKVYDEQTNRFGDLTKEDFNKILDAAYLKLQEFDVNNIKLTGNELISAAERAGAPTDVLEDDHKETVARYNLKEGTTFNTSEAVDAGDNAFNLDNAGARAGLNALGINDDKFITGISMWMYLATEMVLVEDKGKERLNIEVHS